MVRNAMRRSELATVILAAGKGTRLRSRRAKVLHRAGGLALVEHAVRATQPLGAPIFVVVGLQAGEVAALVEPLGAEAILQEPQGGTGHALQVARGALGKFRRALVLPGDAPLVRTETLAALFQMHQAAGAAATVLTALVEEPAGYGRIVRGAEGTVEAIVEEKSASEAERAIREINSGIYCFELEKLWECIDELRPENAHRELYLTDVVALLRHRGERVAAQPAGDPREILGCNTRRELAEVDRLFRRRKLDELMAAGVTIYLPETVLIDPDVEVGPDTILEPGVQLLGATKIAAGCLVSTGSVIIDSVLEEDAVVRPHSVVEESRLGRRAMVGPFARLRPGAELEEDARVGNFVEVKKSRLESGAKAMHLSYLGDATIGRQANIGAGTITCNYNGVRKSRTTIGAGAFVGSGTELVAPVEIGDGAYVAAGSTITENVPADALAIARARQENKPGWARERRARLAAEKVAAAAAAGRSPKLGPRKAKEAKKEPRKPGRTKRGSKRKAPRRR
jgi:bifunctional UDP-N-acetylglucosamine pyrophosphorylase/glucosamine-1-phosphate N-acetyltransferase